MDVINSIILCTCVGLMFDEKAEPVTSAKKICQLALKISRAVVVLR